MQALQLHAVSNKHTHVTTFPLDFCGVGEFEQGFNTLEGVQQEIDFYKEKFNVDTTFADLDEHGHVLTLQGTFEQLKACVIHCWGEENLQETTIETLS